MLVIAVMRAPALKMLRPVSGHVVIVPRACAVGERALWTGLIQGRLIRQRAASGKRPSPMKLAGRSEIFA
jgi:hypothetical protein